MILLNELGTQREQAIYELDCRLAKLAQLRERLSATPEAERTRAQLDEGADAEVALVTAARELVRLDDAHSEETRRLLNPPKPERTN
jgi:hypothetical protein